MTAEDWGGSDAMVSPLSVEDVDIASAVSGANVDIVVEIQCITSMGCAAGVTKLNTQPVFLDFILDAPLVTVCPTGRFDMRTMPRR